MSFFETVRYFFAAGLGATAGYLLFMLCMVLFAVVIAGSGFYILKRNNRKTKDGKETPLLNDLTAMQYVGIVLMCIGLAPFLIYFFQGLMFSLGIQAGSAFVGQLFGQ